MTDRRQHDDPLAGVMARSLAKLLRPGKDCPDAGILAAFYERTLTPAETARWELHFSACARCQEQLAAMARMEPAVAAAPEPQAEGRAGFWNWRWLAPAAAVLGVVTLWVVTRTPETPPLQSPVATIAQDRAAAQTESKAAPAEPAKDADAFAFKEATKAATDRVDPMSQPMSQPKTQPGRADAGPKSTDAPSAFAPAPPQGVAAFPGLRSEAAAAPVAGQTQQTRQAADEQSAGLDKRAAAVTAEKEKKEEAALAPQAISELAVAQKPAAPVAGKDDNKLAQQTQANVAANVARPAEADQAALANQAANQANLANEAAKKTDVAAPEPQAANRFRATEGALRAPEAREKVAAPGYRTVEVAGSAVLWRLGPAGSIERSADGGANWQKQASGVSAELLAGSAPSADVCWVVGRGGVVLRTTDGKTWTQIGSPASVDLAAVEATDASHAIVTTSAGKRYQTADAGRSWRSL